MEASPRMNTAGRRNVANFALPLFVFPKCPGMHKDGCDQHGRSQPGQARPCRQQIAHFRRDDVEHVRSQQEAEHDLYGEQDKPDALGAVFGQGPRGPPESRYEGRENNNLGSQRGPVDQFDLTRIEFAVGPSGELPSSELKESDRVPQSNHQRREDGADAEHHERLWQHFPSRVNHPGPNTQCQKSCFFA